VWNTARTVVTGTYMPRTEDESQNLYRILASAFADWERANGSEGTKAERESHKGAGTWMSGSLQPRGIEAAGSKGRGIMGCDM
jgi:DNA invertase Pin-like site-specific DNA recombinase